MVISPLQVLTACATPGAAALAAIARRPSGRILTRIVVVLPGGDDAPWVGRTSSEKRAARADGAISRRTRGPALYRGLPTCRGHGPPTRTSSASKRRCE